MTGQRLIVIACLAEVACMTGFAGFPTLLPDFLALWQLSTTEAGWINGIYFAAYTVAVAVLVSLTDRVDPRLIYLGSAAIAALSSLGFAMFAEGFWTAMIYRALGGAGLAGTYMPGLKALTDHLEEAQQARGVAFYTATFSIGTAASFLLIGEVSAAWGWRWAFAVAGVGPLVAAAMMIFLMPASRAHEQHPPQHRLLDFRPVLANRQALAYILAYTAHNWELFVLRSWIVAFLVFAQGLQPAGGLGASWNLPAIAAAVNLVGLPSSVLGNEAAQRFGRRRVVITVMGVSAVLACSLGFSAGLPLVLVVGALLPLQRHRDRRFRLDHRRRRGRRPAGPARRHHGGPLADRLCRRLRRAARLRRGAGSHRRRRQRALLGPGLRLGRPGGRLRPAGAAGFGEEGVGEYYAKEREIPHQ